MGVGVNAKWVLPCREGFSNSTCRADGSTQRLPIRSENSDSLSRLDSEELTLYREDNLAPLVDRDGVSAR